MTKRRDKQAIAVFLGVVLSTGVLAGAVEDRTVNHQVRHTGQLEQDHILAGSALLDDRVLTTDSRHLLKVGDRGRYSDRGRGSSRGRGSGHRGRPISRGHSRYRHGGPRYYRGGWSRGDRHYRGSDELLWFGLGVLTPYLLDDRFYY